MYILNKLEVPTKDMQEKVLIYDEEVILVLYDEHKWVFGIELDKNADKIKRIYGSEAKKCEQLFKENFNDRLSPDFKVK